MNRGLQVVPVLLAGSLLFAACASAKSATPTTSSVTSTTTASSTTTSGRTQDHVVTPSVRQGLLDAAAAYHQLPASDYLGLVAGTTYYAFDPSTNDFFAAAGLEPSPNSLPAQIGAQDDGGYNLFVRAARSSTWTVYDDSLGAAQDSTCPVDLPESVLSAWNWSAQSCYPPG
jgi:hypothetical protein